MVAHIDNDCVGLLHEFVVLLSFQVLPAAHGLSQFHCLVARHAIEDQFSHREDLQIFEGFVGFELIYIFEVCLLKMLVEAAQRVCKRTNVGWGPRDCRAWAYMLKSASGCSPSAGVAARHFLLIATCFQCQSHRRERTLTGTGPCTFITPIPPTHLLVDGVFWRL